MKYQNPRRNTAFNQQNMVPVSTEGSNNHTTLDVHQATTYRYNHVIMNMDRIARIKQALSG